MITGESRPVPKREGDRVVAGTVVTDSAIRVRVEAVGEETALAGIRRLVEQAQSSRSRAQALADRAAALLFYFAAGAGLVTLVVWLLLGEPDQAIERTVTVLVIACPHALGLAIPLVIAISTALAARNGILVKDRLALERMRTVDAVLFDKTGTLTTGRADRQRSGRGRRRHRRAAAAGSGGRGRQRASAGPRDRGRGPCPHRRRPAPGERLPVDDRPGRPGPGRGIAGGRRRPGPAARAGRARAGGAGHRDRRLAEPRGHGAVRRPRRQGAWGRWPWRTPCGPSRARPSSSCTGWASGS